MQRTLSTSQFAKAIGVSDSSVRRMADSGELQIHRTQGGHRRIPLTEAVRYVRETRSQVVRPELLGIDSAPAQTPPASAAEEMLFVLEQGKAKAVTSLLQSLYASGMTITGLCDGPIAYAMRTIGDRWQHDKKAIFIEHRATILVARGLHQLRMSIPEPEEDAPKAIGSAMTGDFYLLPTLIASLVLHDCGFQETNLGPNTPLDVLADAVVDERPQLIWLSVNESVRSRTQQLEVLKLAEIAASYGTAFVIGGRHAMELTTNGDQELDAEPGWIRCRTMADLERVALRFV
ncbi:excisionase family DNA-binding protein [Planctomycetaceae bacterium SH139]